MYGPFGAADRDNPTLGQSPATRPLAPQLVQAATWTLQMGVALRDSIEAQLRHWRWGSRVELWSLFLLIAVVPAVSSGSESVVRFDIPALAVAEVDTATAGRATDPDLIEINITIPVTTEIRYADRENVEEFRYDVSWNRNRYPLVGHEPKTETTSHIDGDISIEKLTGSTATAGLTLSGGQAKVLAGAGNAKWSQRDETKSRYDEIPQHDVLVASGTIERGTGAFFRFHRSRKETLEGSRDLQVSFRVPADWRAGLLQVQCQSRGQRQVIGAWNEPFEASQAFVLPIYRAGDQQARDLAVKYVRSEQGLRSRWSETDRQMAGSDFESTVRTFFRGKPTEPPVGWVNSLIESGRDYSFIQVRGQIPDSVANAAGQYVNARKELLQLSR